MSTKENVAAALAAAATNSNSTSSPLQQQQHSDDSYCALCRRCQMRKKLEKRLAERNSNANNSNNNNRNIGTAATGAGAGAGKNGNGNDNGLVGDERSISELLDYIEAGATTNSQNARGSRARRKRAAALKRRQLARSAEEGTRKRRVPAVVAESSSAGSTSSNAHDDIDNIDDACLSCDHGTEEHAISNIPSGDDDDTDSAYGYDDDTDRQVEEFRRLLEAAHVHDRPQRILVHHAQP